MPVQKRSFIIMDSTTMHPIIEHEKRYGAHNYEPLPVVLTRGEGVYVWDDQGNRYIDMMSAYSAVSHGHCHEELVKALTDQARKLTIVIKSLLHR